MASDALPFISSDEYLERDRSADSKCEYYRGRMYAMAGGSFNHSRITANVIRALGDVAAGSSCMACDSNLRIHIPATGLYTYADALLVCGPPQFHDARRDTILNPTLIVEVLSDSTENYDRGLKFWNYRSIPTLREYLLVGQEKVDIEHWAIVDERWTLLKAMEQVVQLTSIRAGISIEAVYEGVEL